MGSGTIWNAITIAWRLEGSSETSWARTTIVCNESVCHKVDRSVLASAMPLSRGTSGMRRMEAWSIQRINVDSAMQLMLTRVDLIENWLICGRFPASRGRTGQRWLQETRHLEYMMSALQNQGLMFLFAKIISLL